MPRKGWTNEDEFEWLADRIGEFRDAQKQRKVGDFHERTIAAFFQRFPLKMEGQDGVAGSGANAKGEGEVASAPDTLSNGEEALSPEALRKRLVRLFSSLVGRALTEGAI